MLMSGSCSDSAICGWLRLTAAATCGSADRRPMFSRPRYRVLGSLAEMNLPSCTAHWSTSPSRSSSMTKPTASTNTCPARA